MVVVDRAEPAAQNAPVKSERYFTRAQQVIPGGVNSPVRSLKAVNQTPIFIDRADGAYLYDVDGNEYVDYVLSWGPMVLGHRYPKVLEYIEDVLQKGTSFGAPSPYEVELAELICKLVPSIEMVRMVSSGTEACMSAVRLARAFTGRNLIIKFDGCYHGHADSFLVKAGSGMATLAIASTPGVPEELSKLTISLPFNDAAAVEKALKEHKDQVAAIIIEPIVGNSGLLVPKDDYLPALRELSTKYGALLIFDEVMTGFRVALGGAQAKYSVKPDLTCLGKILGAGMPVGAFGGRRDIMERIAPLGDVYQAGTLSGNPLAMAAGLAQLRTLQSAGTYEMLAEKTKRLADGIDELSKKAKVPAQVVHVPGMLSVFFTKENVANFAQAQTSDIAKFAQVWQTLAKNGVYWPPSQFESAFTSVVHTKLDIERTLAAWEVALS
jgi:glutamate-1-semialdehyde 2,1-aminomutase